MKQKSPSNSLTRLFNEKKPSLDEVLENPDLSISIRYEIDQLVEFIVPKECDRNNCPILIQILDYALPIDKNKIQKNLIYRRNAASILSTICNKLQVRINKTDLLKERIEKFILPGNTINEQYDFAGHFQRITETYLRFQVKEKNDRPFKDVSFIKNILSKLHIISYRFLVANIFSDFPQFFIEKKSEDDIMTNVSRYISKQIGSAKYNNETKYYFFYILFQIYQQNENVFAKFYFDGFESILLAAISFGDNILYMSESFRIIDLLIPYLDQQSTSQHIDSFARRYRTKLEEVAKMSKFNLCTLFRVFWKFFLNSQRFDVMQIFFDSDPYIFGENDVTNLFYIKMVNIFSNMDSKTRYGYMDKLNIVQKAINYSKKLKENSTPNLCILQFIDLMAQPLKSDEYNLSIQPSDNNIMFSKEWVDAVFYAKRILTERKDAINYAKRDFIDSEESNLY